MHRPNGGHIHLHVINYRRKYKYVA